MPRPVSLMGPYLKKNIVHPVWIVPWTTHMMFIKDSTANYSPFIFFFSGKKGPMWSTRRGALLALNTQLRKLPYWLDKLFTYQCCGCSYSCCHLVAKQSANKGWNVICSWRSRHVIKRLLTATELPQAEFVIVASKPVCMTQACSCQPALNYF